MDPGTTLDVYIDRGGTVSKEDPSFWILEKLITILIIIRFTMAYGSRSNFRKSSTSSYRRNRFGNRSAFKSTYRKKTTPYTRKLKFATVGYVRNQEKKYVDKVGTYVDWTGYSVRTGSTAFGMKFVSSGEYIYNMSTSGQNIMSGVPTGATVSSRIGNKINVKYLQCGLTLQAASTPAPMGGEIINTEIPAEVPGEYLKTSYRIVLVKDLQANNNTNNVSWGDVFGDGGGNASTELDALATNDFLDIKNMGRFVVVKDIRFILDADDPLKCINFMVKNIGQIRYNLGSEVALTNIGYYILIGQDVIGTATTSARVKPSPAICNTRLCFTD